MYTIVDYQTSIRKASQSPEFDAKPGLIAGERSDCELVSVGRHSFRRGRCRSRTISSLEFSPFIVSGNICRVHCDCWVLVLHSPGPAPGAIPRCLAPRCLAVMRPEAYLWRSARTRLAGRLVCCRRGTHGLPRCAEGKHPVLSSIGAIGAPPGGVFCGQRGRQSHIAAYRGLPSDDRRLPKWIGRCGALLPLFRLVGVRCVAALWRGKSLLRHRSDRPRLKHNSVKVALHLATPK